MRKKLFSVLILSMVVLFGCQQNGFQPKNLKVVAGDKETSSYAVEYEAETVKEGIKALPFKMKLPKKLPEENMKFLPPIIADLDNDGKKIVAEFRTSYIADEIDLIISAYYPKGVTKPYPFGTEIRFDEIELKDGSIGEYKSGGMSFDVEEVTYYIFYLDTSKDEKEIIENLVELANQMF